MSSRRKQNTDHFFGSYLANQHYSLGVPQPPHVFVPPPILSSTEDATQLASKFQQISPGGVISNSDFLKFVTYDQFQIRDHILDWKYTERQNAQEILPFLFLGPLAAARDRAFLKEKGITLVMGVRDKLSAASPFLNPKAPKDLGIPTTYLDVGSPSELISALPGAVDAINNHLAERYQAVQSKEQQIPGRVLVFCESGNDRSATVVAAYIMTMYSVGMVDAIQVIQCQRFCVGLDEEYRFLLRSFDDILVARRAVSQANSGSEVLQVGNNTGKLSVAQSKNKGAEDILQIPSKISSGRKRGLDDMYEDVEMENSDIVTPIGREGSAPFHTS
jgi:serine/threonine/tyrosine-interacting protein